jgi:hypothetical protein
MTFSFITNQESQVFCEQIAYAISRIYSISIERAVDEINMVWNGQDFVDVFDVRYHETFDYWAKRIMQS